MLRYLSAREASSFTRANCSLFGTDNAHEQLSDHNFAPNGTFCVYYPSNIFRKHAVLKIGEYLSDILGYSPVLAGYIQSRDALDQWRASKNT